MKTPLNPRRRQFLATAAGLGGLLAAPLASARSSGRQPVVVVTSYNDETFSRFEAAFEKANPRYKLQLVWRMPHDALPYLRQPAQGGADVYWAASPRTFATLAADGAWQPLGIARDGLPENIGNARLSDANGLYTATEMAGYGFIVNPGALARLGLAEPKDWRDLTASAYAGQIVMPIPSRVGFAPVMVDILLQAYGWEKGWATWSAIAGNAGTLMDRGSTFVTDEVGSGRIAATAKKSIDRPTARRCASPTRRTAASTRRISRLPRMPATPRAPAPSPASCCPRRARRSSPTPRSTSCRCARPSIANCRPTTSIPSPPPKKAPSTTTANSAATVSACSAPCSSRC